MSELKAVWITDYDYRTDKTYKRPGCPDCEEAIGRFRNVYKCYNCGAAVEVEDEEMKVWFSVREEKKKEFHDCIRHKPINGVSKAIGCGGKKCVETIYTRNPVTLKWQAAYGKCLRCGMSFMV